MTTAPVRPIPAPSIRLTVHTVPSLRREAVDRWPTAQQLADTARRVADTYTELLTPAEFDPTTFPRDEDVTCTAGGVVQSAGREVTAAAGAVEQARALTAGAAPLRESYCEPLRRLEPMVRRLTETIQPGEIDALVTLRDRLPQLADAMDHEVIPLLGHLDQVGPDLNQLLDRVAHLSRMADRLPKVFRRRNHPGP